MTAPQRNGIAAAATQEPRFDNAINPLKWPLELFSSVWLGIFLLTCLFLYSSIGSAGAPIGPGMLRPWFILNPDAWVSVRQLPAFEMTEFEWFHWWPFDLLIALICINLVVTTLRRIPFNVVNLGVWMIHTGIIMLCLGSVWYFSTKVEGDTPVNRRMIRVQLPSGETATMMALPGARAVVGTGSNAYLLQVTSIDPFWELRSGDDVGTKAYSVSVLVQSQGGQFIRQLLAGYPQYTEDMIRSDDPQQPMQRAVKALGKPLVDEAIELTLDFSPQNRFFLMDSHAVYLRELNADGTPQTPWIQRPIRGLPRYNDYIAASDDVFVDPSDVPPVRPLNIAVPPTEPGDPLPGVDLRVSRYLRYAQIESRRRPTTTGPINPAINVRLSTSPAQSNVYELIAFDPQQSVALENTMRFVWVDSQAQIDEWKVRHDPAIRFRVPGSSVDVVKTITTFSGADPAAPFEPIEGTEYSFRVEGVHHDLVIGEKRLSVAVVEIRTPQRMFTRWVFDDPTNNRDMAMSAPGSLDQHTADIPADKAIETTFVPGKVPPAPILLIAGPGEEDLSLMVTLAEGQPTVTRIKPGESVPIANGVSLDVLKYAARTETETRPFVVPREQRDREMRENLSMIRVDLPLPSGMQTAWLPYHLFAFENPQEVLRRFPYRTVTLALEGDRRVELMFSRQSMALPAPVALDDFQVASHVGGFTGQASSIMDWISMITFKTAQGWTDPKPVSMNKPKEFEGFWFFQAQWDPPDPPRFEGDSGSRGLNYTVLGVGNRNGVNVQLLGCCIAVIGMIYAFYGKPAIKRRRANKIYGDATSQGIRRAGQVKMDAMVAEEVA